MIEFECMQCGSSLRVENRHAGRTAWCRRCKRPVLVPSNATPVVDPVEEFPTPPSPPKIKPYFEPSLPPPEEYKETSVKRGPIQATDTDPRAAALLTEIDRRGRVIAQLTSEVETLRQAAESRAREGDLLEAELAAARKVAVSDGQGAGRERAMVEELNAIVNTQRELLVEKDEKLIQLNATLRRVTRFSGESNGDVELPDLPSVMPESEQTSDMPASTDGDARMGVELDEARRLAQHRASEVRTLRNALDDMAAKFDRITVELRNAVLKLTETQQDNNRLVSELAAARDQLRNREFELEHRRPEQAADADATEGVDEFEEPAPAPMNVEAVPEPLWTATPAPRAELVQALPPREATVASEASAPPTTDIQHDQRVLVDALLRFLGRR